MYPDFKELLSVLNAHRVKYLVVGAYAVAIHAQPRATKDLDILVRARRGEREGGFCSIGSIRSAASRPDRRRFRRTRAVLSQGREPIGIDILTEAMGVDFDAAWERRVEDVINPETGLKANFISRDDLIAAKLALGRLQDLADVDAIRKAAESLLRDKR
jgi:hypothetical protein